ncbi:MAG TPA: molybdopterin-dependent oxidoreductase [bacterium]|nr:molybdopterin-dependent oxidoreductase [bacterium]
MLLPQRKKAALVTVAAILLISLPGCGSSPPEAEGTVIIEGGAITKPVSFTLAQLMEMEEGLIKANYFALNSYGTREHFQFEGIWVWHLLQEKVNLKDGAAQVSFIGQDGYQVDFTLAEIKREDYLDEENPTVALKMILAWAQDEEEFDPARGNPFQLVIGQREPGHVNKPYWVRNVKTIRID